MAKTKTADELLQQVARIRERFPVMSAARRVCVNHTERVAILAKNAEELRGVARKPVALKPVRFVEPEKLAAALLERQSCVKVGLGKYTKER